MSAALTSLRRDDGQGLIEMIVALTILAVGIGAVLTVLTASSLSLQRSDQKGTALTLAESQIELYRNVSFGEIRLADASFSAAPLTNGSDVYFTANASDSTIPSGAKSNQITDSTVGTVPCGASPPPECQPVRTVTGPDHRLYRVDTYITNVTPTDTGTSSGNAVGDAIKQVTVVVRNAQLASLPVLARNSSTFSPINAAAGGGKAVPNIALTVPKAWVTQNGTHIDATSITATLSNMLPNPTNQKGVLTFYAIAGLMAPSPPCGSTSWTQVGTATVDNDNDVYQPTGPGLDVAAGNTYWWYVTFSGDPDNMSQTSRCSPAMSSTVVQAAKWTPSISISAPSTATTGVPVAASSITAKLANASPGAGGTIHFYYVAGSAPSSCTGGTELGSVATTGSASYSQANAFPSSTKSTYWWYATYDPGSDPNNASATSVCGGTMPSTVVDDGPTATAVQMKDANANGKIDQVVVTFNKTLAACASPCTAGWTLSNVPSGGTLSSVSISGSTATLTLNEGAGAPDTSVGLFSVALDPTSSVVDAAGRHASFTSWTPADAAGPVPISIASTSKSGGTAGKAEAGDTVTVTFSEPIATIGGTTSTVTLSTVGGGGSKPVSLNLSNLSGVAFQIGAKNNYLSGNGGTSAVFGPTGSSAVVSGSTVTVTLGAWNGAGSLSTGSYVAGSTTAFTPATTIKDAAGNAAAGSLATTIRFF